MAAILDIQQINNGQLPKSGQVFVGAVDTDPLTSPVTVYSDKDYTQAVITPLTLDFNGRPIDPATGEPINLYVNFSYTIQWLDDQGAPLLTSPVSVNLEGGVSGIGPGTNTNVAGTASIPIVNLDADISLDSIDMNSIIRGLLLNGLTTAQRDAIGAPLERWLIYNTTTKTLDFYNGSTWISPSATPSGPTNAIQTNVGSVFTGNANFIFDPTGDGEVQLLDDTKVSWGDSQDFNISFDSINLVMEMASLSTSNYIVRLGTADGSASFKVNNNSNVPQFDVDSFGNTTVCLDNGVFSIKSSSDFTMESDGSKTDFTSKKGDFTLINTNVTGGTVMKLATDTTATNFRVTDNTDNTRLLVNGLGQVAVGTASPDASAKFQIDSTTQGVLPPRMTTTQRDAISSPSEGLEIYNTSTKRPEFYNDTVWGVTSSNLQESYESGASIVVDNTLGAVKLDNTGKTVASFEMVPNATTPTTDLSPGQFHVSNDGVLYTYDSTRSKFLSQEVVALQFGKNNAAGNEYLRFGGDARDGGSGAIFPWDVTVVGFTLKGSNSVIQNYDIEIDGTGVSTIATSSSIISNSTLNLDAEAGETINLFAQPSGSEVDDPYAIIFVKRRI